MCVCALLFVVDSYERGKSPPEFNSSRQSRFLALFQQLSFLLYQDFIARFGHGTVKMVRQAQAREKLLQKKLEAGLTEMPEQDPQYDWTFPDAGELPVPVLSIENISFNYPNGPELYSNVDFGVDLQTRVALVGTSAFNSRSSNVSFVLSRMYHFYCL